MKGSDWKIKAVFLELFLTFYFILHFIFLSEDVALVCLLRIIASLLDLSDKVKKGQKKKNSFVVSVDVTQKEALFCLFVRQSFNFFLGLVGGRAAWAWAFHSSNRRQTTPL